MYGDALVLNKSTTQKKEAVTMAKRVKSLSVEEMEARLGINRIPPVILAPSDMRDMQEKDDYFEDWYENELRKRFEPTT